MPTPPIRPLVAAALIGVSVLGITAPAFAVSTDIRCRGDQCDDGRWGLARGDWNQNGYWGMFAGHNCTNYVAWRLIDAGVAEPAMRLGNASTWAERAAASGIVVDHIPEAGAVAQWDSGAGMGSAGHVAFIEEVYDDGTMLISEDYWRGGSQTGLLTYRTIPVDSVSNIIHFQGVDVALRLRQAVLGSAGWEEATRQYAVAPDRITATQTPDGSPLVVATVEGRLVELAADASLIDTGIASTATSLASVSRGSMDYVFAVQDGTLIMNIRTEDGWQQMPTGLEGIVGDIAVVDEGTITPTVLLSQAGNLYVIYLDTEGWQLYSTGSAATGPIQAVIADGVLNVFGVSDVDSVVQRTWWDGSSWSQESTGVVADAVAAAAVGAAGTEAFVTVDGKLSELTHSDAGWQLTATGLRTGSATTAVSGGSAPSVFQVG